MGDVRFGARKPIQGNLSGVEMKETALNIASSRFNAGVSALKQSLGTQRAAMQLLDNLGGADTKDSARPAQQVAKADLKAQDVDRTAPRGTYLNITV